mgnify:CR=1 FL=1
MKAIKTDVLIIGSGISALMLAELLHEHKNVIILTKSEWKNSNSWKAQGGIAAVTTDDDDWTNHFYDTMTAGNFHNKEEMVALLVKKGPEMVGKLIDLGVPFDKDSYGNLARGKEGAHSKRRILHAGGDQTGKVLIESLYERVATHTTIKKHTSVLELIVSNNRCVGVFAKGREEEPLIYEAEHIVLATGGAGMLYPVTSNDETVTGDGIAMAYRAGARLTDLEFIQFHPTMLVHNHVCYGLVSEALRGEGAILENAQGEPIMEGIHPYKDLAPRDIVARRIFEFTSKNEPIYLNINMIDNFSSRFPTITSLCKKATIDITKGKIPVAPGAHFLMGGICTNEFGETTVDGLYAIGEVACTGVHGANRLASNSLLEGIVFAEQCKNKILQKESTKIEPYEVKGLNELQVPLLNKTELQQKMFEYVGLVRNEESLQKMKTWLQPYQSEGAYFSLSKDEYERFNMAQLAYLITTSALNRKESRGGHYRSDYPKPCNYGEQKFIIKELNNYEYYSFT